MKKKLTALMIAAGIALTGCTTINTQPDEQAVRYSDPMMGAKKFQECYGPSQYDMNSIMNNGYTYPAGQRVYAFQPEGGDGGPFSVATKDGVSLGVEGAVRFTLTTDCEDFKHFHERVGLKMKAYEDEGWREFLKVYLRAPINRALTDATQGREWAEIYSSPEAKAEWERKVAELLPRYVEQTIGGNYLVDYEVTLQKPILPEDLENALRDTQVAVQQTRAQQERNSQVDTELESIEKLVEVLGPDGYNTYQAIKDGKITVLPIPQGSDVVVGANG